MKTVTQHLRDRLLGFLKPKPTLKELYRTEWSPEMEQLARNRLIIGALRYGRMGVGGKPDYDRMASLIERAQMYQKDGNQEHLVDIFNFSMLEFVEGTHPNKHMKSVDGHNYHTTIK